MLSSGELRTCQRYLHFSKSEATVAQWLAEEAGDFVLLVAEGFEERSVGFVERLAVSGRRAQRVVIGRYSSNVEANARYRARFEGAAGRVGREAVRTAEIDSNGEWVAAEVREEGVGHVVIDITGLSAKALFCALDAVARATAVVTLAYTEPREYWPTKAAWMKLRGRLTRASAIADIVDTQPWLFGHQHRVELIPGHEGYDSAGSGRALIGFLPFKSARLGAVLSEEDYERCVFIAGRPRLRENLWRLDALKRINRDIVKEWPLVEMSTFGFRQALRQLFGILAADDTLMGRYDIHMAPLGSKLQDVACWVLSELLPAITMVTSVPFEYFPQAFSEGIGAGWVFPLLPPRWVGVRGG